MVSLEIPPEAWSVLEPVLSFSDFLLDFEAVGVFLPAEKSQN